MPSYVRVCLPFTVPFFHPFPFFYLSMWTARLNSALFFILGMCVYFVLSHYL
jgi:hypothetical protein